MATTFSLILFITLSFAFCSHADLISDKCAITSDASLCISTLRSNPKSASADVNGLIEIIFGTTIGKAVPVRNTINQILKTISDPVAKKAYTGCSADFDIILSKLPDTIKLVGKNNREVVNQAQEVIERVKSCDSALIEAGIGSQFASNSALVEKLARIGGQLALNTIL